MTDIPPPEFGKPWAAKDETRPWNFRTPLAHAMGANGGVLFVRDGRDSDRWMMLGEWFAWVKEAQASQVADDVAAQAAWIDDGSHA